MKLLSSHFKFISGTSTSFREYRHLVYGYYFGNTILCVVIILLDEKKEEML